MNKRGFTLVELVVSVIMLISVSSMMIFLTNQLNNKEVSFERDSDMKLNSMFIMKSINEDVIRNKGIKLVSATDDHVIIKFMNDEEGDILVENGKKITYRLNNKIKLVRKIPNSTYDKIIYNNIYMEHGNFHSIVIPVQSSSDFNIEIYDYNKNI